MSSNGNNTPTGSEGFSLSRPFAMNDRTRTQQIGSTGGGDATSPSLLRVEDASSSPSPSPAGSRGRERQRDANSESTLPVRCINPASEVNARLDTQVEVRVYPCNNSQGGAKKKFTTFTIKPEVSDWSRVVALPFMFRLVLLLPE
jgi:hypothetical protein